MQNKDYRDRWGISQSMIKDFRFKSPKKWKEIHVDKKIDIDKKEETFVLGSLTDTLLFSPDRLDERFIVSDETKLPSPAVQIIVRNIYNEIVRQNEEIDSTKDMLPEVVYKDLSLTDEAMILHYINIYEEVDKEGNKKVGWYSNRLEPTRIKNLIEQGTDYFDSIKRSNGRKIISSEMNMEAIALRDTLYKSEEVKDYFIQNENNLLIFQLEIFSEYLLNSNVKMPIKGALDILRFNHIDKTVQIVDFKCSYSAHDFIKSIKQFGYCDQLSFYDHLLRNWLYEYCDGKYCEYKIIAPINIVIDIKDKVPYIYEYDWRDLAIAADGNRDLLYSLYQTHDHNQKIKKGWKEILEEIGWHYGENKWDKPKELYLNNKIKVNLLNS